MAIDTRSILLIEDNDTDVTVISQMLIEAKGFWFALEYAEDLAGGLQKLAEKRFDLVLLDLTLPDSTGLGAVINLREAVPQVPIVIFTGLNDEALGIEAVHAGAQDYLLKGEVTSRLLSRAIGYAIERHRLATENAQLYEELFRYANTLEKRVEERTAQLLGAKQHIEAILNNSSDAILVIYGHDVIHTANPAFCRLWDYTHDELAVLTLDSLFEPTCFDLFKTMLSTVRAENQSRRLEISARRKDGRVFPADLALSPVTIDSQVGIICSLRDITERKQTELELRKTLDKERELGDLKMRFISTVSHEFRTPLSVIMMTNDTLRRYGHRMTEEQKNNRLRVVESEIKHMASLLEDVLAIGWGISGKAKAQPISLDLETFCMELVEELKLIEENDHIEFSCAGTVFEAFLDQRLLRLIITNLVSNAVKYSHPDNLILLELFCNDDQVIFTVSDKGIGIPYEDQPHLFEPFHRGQNVGTISGTGLGLNIVKQAVELQQGSIDFESQPGDGTTFKVILPRIVELVKG